MKVAVLGNTPLANAVRANCDKHFGGDPGQGADVLWVCDSREYVRPSPGQLVILSWPNPVGTCAKWETARYIKSVTYAVVPENVREAHAESDFAEQAFMCVGWRTPETYTAELLRQKTALNELLHRFTDAVYWMSPESAEMFKHAMNGYLALQITYANEIAVLCEKHGADADDVMRAVAADPRKYLAPGGPPGTHLMREVNRLDAL